ncbi:hypothetical protein GGTG_00162 [Gaeumannomyces tritici R3-111a-1]|uniref:Uncharacterized protein n=1 Tax=Gaeumannomyces tritici (strain R3-111a-1) TaxID=644352 RepID=J3NFW8_GAET3|nr:hypothetical protein GGTG_00162 [Gaeumannomyces tritici R3-111a-1]EJT80158.1 hypothetical protein GGTG_00162 [Gaeumannomyces tritici R3-111a-1]
MASADCMRARCKEAGRREARFLTGLPGRCPPLHFVAASLDAQLRPGAGRGGDRVKSTPREGMHWWRTTVCGTRPGTRPARISQMQTQH